MAVGALPAVMFFGRVCHHCTGGVRSAGVDESASGCCGCLLLLCRHAAVLFAAELVAKLELICRLGMLFCMALGSLSYLWGANGW